MAVCTINISFDYLYFETVLTYVLYKPVICALLVNPPVEYSSSEKYREVTSSMTFRQLEHYILLIKPPAVFCQYASGSSLVSYGVVSCGNKTFGLIISHYYDFLGESINVLGYIVPVVLTSLKSLLLGTNDFEGNPVTACEDIFILGANSCRNYPVPEDYVWPDLERELSNFFTKRLYGSQVFRSSCCSMPLIYDWQSQDVYISTTEDYDPHGLYQKFDKMMHQINEKNQLETDLMYKRIANNFLEPSAIFSFIKSPYDVNYYRSWDSSGGFRDLKIGSRDVFFFSTWVQHLSFSSDWMFTLDDCAHRITSPNSPLDMFPDLGPVIPSAKTTIPEYSIYHAPKPSSTKMSPYPRIVNDLSEFWKSVDHIGELLFSLKAIPPRATTDFIIFSRGLERLLLRPIQACRMVLVPSDNFSLVFFCPFNLPHRVEPIYNYQRHPSTSEETTSDSE